MKHAIPLVLLVLPLTVLAAAPAAGSPEEAVRESLRLLRDGKVDQWIADWCAPEKCISSNLEELKTYSIARAQNDAKNCLHGDQDEITVTRIKGDPATDAAVTVWIQCEPGRMPAPSTAKRIDGKWKFTAWSW